MCKSELTEVCRAELIEFSLLKQYSQNSVPPVSHVRKVLRAWKTLRAVMSGPLAICDFGK